MCFVKKKKIMESLDQLRQSMSDFGVTRLYAKRLAPNDNSKNQVYLGSNFDVLNLFPNLQIFSDPSPQNNILKSPLDYFWLEEDGNSICAAPGAQLVLYPQYPEVRFSGFLRGCAESPSQLMRSREQDRILFFGVKPMGEIIGFVVAPDSPISAEAIDLQINEELFIEVSIAGDSRSSLLRELLRIHQQEWIESKRLDRDRNLVPCRAQNCGGYTLEAELGVIPNGDARPDFLGWEVKQFQTGNINNVNLDSKPLTLLTPQPTGGYYVEHGVRDFVRNYGYDDMRGREDRKNYGGRYFNNQPARRTGHILTLSGYDPSNGSFDSQNGGLHLLAGDRLIARWGFDTLLTHWNRKHAKAVYVPSNRRDTEGIYQYRYSHQVFLGEGTNFSRFLKAFHDGRVFYDPGIKVENISSANPRHKHRSQFRIKAHDLSCLYNQWEEVNLLG